MIFIDSDGNETTVMADAVAASFEGTSFLLWQDGKPTVDISAATVTNTVDDVPVTTQRWLNGISFDTQVAGGQWNSIDGGRNWLRAR